MSFEQAFKELGAALDRAVIAMGKAIAAFLHPIAAIDDDEIRLAIEELEGMAASSQARSRARAAEVIRLELEARRRRGRRPRAETFVFNPHPPPRWPASLRAWRSQEHRS